MADKYLGICLPLRQADTIWLTESLWQSDRVPSIEKTNWWKKKCTDQKLPVWVKWKHPLNQKWAKNIYILHLKLEIQARSDAYSEAFADRNKLKEVTAFLMWMTDTSKWQSVRWMWMMGWRPQSGGRWSGGGGGGGEGDKHNRDPLRCLK